MVALTPKSLARYHPCRVLVFALWLGVGCNADKMSEPITWQPCNTESLDRAKKMHQPVLIDFFAPWCASCIHLDKQVFASASVQKALVRFMAVRCDMQNSDASTQAMLQRFEVQTLPNIAWLNAEGKECKAQRIASLVSPKKFIQVAQQMD